MIFENSFWKGVTWKRFIFETGVKNENDRHKTAWCDAAMHLLQKVIRRKKYFEKVMV